MTHKIIPNKSINYKGGIMMSLIPASWLSFINFLENAQTIMAMVSISLVLSAISLLVLVICLLRLKFKLANKI
jgi:hypothetical protein